MFREEYKKAYDSIKPDHKLVEKLKSEAADGSHRKRGRTALIPVIITASFLVLVWNVIPVCATGFPAFYKVLGNISPNIADLFVPVEKSCTQQGITMCVEAVNLDGSSAEVIVSFYDETDEGRIRGKVDLFEGYGLKSYTGDSVIGGLSFLEYDEREQKAYFMISVETDGSFDEEKLTFYASELLTGIEAEKRDIPLSGLQKEFTTKRVTISGSGGTEDLSRFPGLLPTPGNTEDPRPAYPVMDTGPAEDHADDDFTVTGAAYQDDILRVQICMGDNTHADRHAEPFLIDSDGNERHEDYSVSWHEDAAGRRYTFYEYWFFGPIENPGDCRMYGIFHDTGESISGSWKVTFRLDSRP